LVAYSVVYLEDKMGITLPESVEIQQPGLLEALGTGIGGGLQTGMQAGLQNLLAGQQATQPITEYQQLQTALRAKELEQKEKFQKERTSEWEYTQSKDFRKEVTSNYKEALESDMRLNKMRELNAGGKLTAPGTKFLLDKMGIPLGVLNDPNSEEFDKLSKDMLKNIRTYFGARINAIEVENFLKTIPTLTNSQEGRNRVIDNLQMLLEPRKMMFNEYRRLREESLRTGERLPIDLEETVIENISPQLDALSKRFEAGPSQQIGKKIAPETREFKSMPSPKDYSGAVIEDDKGNKYKSDGKKWRKL